MAGKRAGQSVTASLVLTLGSAALWGLAHLWVGRRLTGALLMGIYTALIATIVTALFKAQPELLSLAVQPSWLWTFALCALLFAAATVTVVIRSYQLVRPDSMTGPVRYLSALSVGLLCAMVIAPMAYVARLALVSQHVVTSVFAADTAPIPVDPWRGRDRVNLLLIGADAAPRRPGVRTDSMTVASVDTRTGDTVLFGLPRNLERVPMPAGPARDHFPYGFGGEPPYTPGLLNEVFQYAEDYPGMVPGVPRGHRGPILLKKTISDITGLDITNYAMVDMSGFADIINAMGGVKVTVKQPIVYGRQNEGLIRPGTRKLSGEEALWFGRARTYSDDYVRMGRQKCLMNAVAKQADPVTVLRSFEKLADATMHAVSTDIPQALLPNLIDLSEKVKQAKIKSFQFVPPLINTAYPDYPLIKHKISAILAAENSEAAAPTGLSLAKDAHTHLRQGVATLDSTCN
ncbi:anionic cell wall polymer biosynthesis LytR-Cps2A-Psr (LCP) family protein [Streptosporangium album]|uniref:Anionic cell wall polymer biosynthesis LytR-Cps2A-Psr (LCP) family protein n=1 Tax=Streptosporangium album TaxID=47479 RepID=A0A7W7RUS4_9ACTN|nr:LCP family protein [Streptosporangium album]MBB4938634.1 anionic cell wall polymer biosynthesis LytR-Cps2A-Psr (LCP) family protein [Streptosporangium album]